MKRLPLLFLFLLVLLVSGCSWLSKDKTAVGDEKSLLKTVNWVQASKLKKGSKVLIVPFSPGKDVAANDDTDRLALKVVKGCAEVVMGDPQEGLIVLNMEEAAKADYILKGRIQRADIIQSGFLGFFRKVHKSIKVSGSIIDVNDDGLIMEFSHHRQSRKGHISLNELALLLGRDIGNYLIRTSERK
ncbi:MAG: hypothetical protein KAR05_00715 [Candidatus Omnitrophica bacterium]|nr:hypothetical protein [Candidatus Omnitrophota bacterium]